MNELALFTGGGGGILGGRLLGWRARCAVEINAYARRTLLARQKDKTLEPFPIWDDVSTFDGRPWRGAIDVVSAGFPCQDISSCGKGVGISGARSGLWKHGARIIREVQPAYVLLENSPLLASKGLHVVLADLSEMGFDAKWGVLSAADSIWSFGTPCIDHERERIWIVAIAHAEILRRGSRGLPFGGSPPLADAFHAYQAPADASRERRGKALELRCYESAKRSPWSPEADAGDFGGWWKTEPDVDRMVHGVAHRVDRVRTIGNGQVPAVVELAWNILAA